ncbi:unnamed protein product [Callosobruchus maculatus]|nr:unnamed protein product [Callosobruchus maculatus]
MTGDYVDVRLDNGAWYEAQIIKITASETNSVYFGNEFGLIFTVKSAPYVEDFKIDVMFHEIRPRSFYVYKTSELKREMVVLVNYNIENPKALGNWYDFIIEEVSRTSNIRGTILLGGDKKPIAGCYLNTKNVIMRIEKPVKRSEKSCEDITYQPRKYAYNCEKCNDVQERKCKYCSCCVCGGKEDWDSTILCDECDDGYHLTCLKPPLESVPDEEWYCPECKNDNSEIVKAGEGLKQTKKRKRASKENIKPGRRNVKEARNERSREHIIIPSDNIRSPDSSPSTRKTRSCKIPAVLEPKTVNAVVRNSGIESKPMKRSITTEKYPVKEQRPTEIVPANDTDLTDTSDVVKKYSVYSILQKIQHLINDDKQNIKMWEECMKALVKGEQHFLGVVQDVFMCVCCQEVVKLPVTTECKHNVCRDCLRRSFAFEIYSCPCCRYNLGKDYRLVVNKNLGAALERLFSVFGTRKTEMQLHSSL